MRQDYKTIAEVQLVYIHNKKRDSNVIQTLEKYGGVNTQKYGKFWHEIYYIAPNGIIETLNLTHLPLLLKAGYREIQIETPIEEYTIEEIDKLLGKDPDSIRIKK